MVRKSVRDKKKKRRANAREIAEKELAGFQPNCFTVPPNTFLFRLKDSKPKRVDILEYELGKGNPAASAGLLHYERTFYRHPNVGINRQPYTCPMETANKPCPICEYRAKLQRRGDADPELVKGLLAKKRQLFNIFDQSEPEKGVQLWEFSSFQFGELLHTEIRDADEEDELDFFASWEDDGKSLKLSVQENPPYGFKVVSIGFKSRKTALSQELVDSIHCLDELIIVPEYDALRDLFLQAEEPLDGEEPREEDGDDEEEERKKKPSARKSKPERKKTAEKPSPEPPDDDDDDDDDGGEPLGDDADLLPPDDDDGFDDDDWD